MKLNVHILQSFEEAYVTSTVLNKVEVLKALDDEQMIAVDVVYQPDVIDAHGHWMSKETVAKACENFNQNLSTGNVKPNLYHALHTDKFEITKSWINQVDAVIGDQLVPAGTWLAETKFNDPALWEMKKSGEIQGISVGMKARLHEPDDNTEE